MTVHTLPRPGAEMADDIARTRSGRWKMIVLFLICAAPVIASYFTYYVVRPGATSSYGQLIDPQRPLPAWAGADLEGRTVPLASLKDQWLLISVADRECGQPCEQHLYLQRQLREMLGKNKDRLDWVLLYSGDEAIRDELRPALEQGVALKVDSQALAQWLAPAPGQQLSDHLYLVDPMGNWMLRFPADMDHKQVRKDLERLMRASAFWDQAGRPSDSE
ncbi:hypothetical protein [Hydrogenophaga sp. 5NK40-0174]|uniref:SCO family protein n=1 Tax=Hydrogenophaga sp. 5NK40-0174 TaxID=3127649 RepID=UPI003342AF9C